MFDKMLEAGAYFDWITPLITIGQNIANGGGHSFAVPADCGWSGHDIDKRLLRPAGIKSWGYMVHGGSIMFTVHKGDAPRAQAILQQNGIIPESKAPKGYKEQGKGEGDYQPGSGWSLW